MSVTIGVCGSGELNTESDEQIFKSAEIIGKEIARRKGVLICGGKEGVMKAVCKGARQEGGLTVGILPYTRSEKNEYVNIPIVTGIGHKRNDIIISSADCIIFLAGKWGTFNEISLAILHQTPIVFLEGSSGIVDTFINSDIINDIPSDFRIASDPVQAVDQAFELARRSNPKD
jgi:uncharacterized protein (TIGR00725 family)